MTESSKIRVTVVIRKIAFGTGVGGMERAAARHIEGMLTRGMRVRLITSLEAMDGTPPPGLELVDVPWPKYLSKGGGPTFGLAYARWVSKVRNAICLTTEYREVLHLHGASAGVLDGPMRFSAAARVVNPHGLEAFGKYSLKRVPNRIFLRALARRGRYADRIIATDPTLESVIIANVRCSRDKVEHIANAVDIDQLSRMATPRANDSHPFEIITIGRLVTNKGYDLLLDALRQDDVRRALPDEWRWVHFGSGPMRHELLERSREEPTVNLEIREGRPDSEVQGFLSTADLFVQPSRFEGSSLTTLEAMVHGRVIVATAVGGIPDKISDGVTGFLASEASVREVASSLVRALEQPHTGVAAGESVRKNYGSKREGDKYEALYRRLLIESH